jgi:hypothetical protein
MSFLAIFEEKKDRENQLYFFIQFLVIKTLDMYPDPNPDSLEMPDPDFNESGSTTQKKIIKLFFW